MMKKILLSFSFIFALCIASFAQTVTVTGTVTDANGNPMGGYPVYISSDTTAMGNVYFSTVFTNNNGVFTDNAAPIQNAMGGIYYASVVDSCTGALSTQFGAYTPNTLLVNNLNFTICSVAPPSCSVTMTSTGQDSIYTFTATASGGTAPYTYLWDFGDGNVLTNSSATYTHLYAANGTYNACVTAIDAAGCISVTCNTIIVTSYSGNTGCSASYQYNYGFAAPDVFFHGQATGQAPFTYLWDFGDGAVDTAQNPVHIYAQTGVYMPCLTITDAGGCTSTYCDSLFAQGANANNCAVTANVSMNNATASFSATATGQAPFTYHWDFGDGNVSTVANPTHTYGMNGIYGACVTITDATGCLSTDCVTVTNTTPPTSGDIFGIVVTDSINFGSATAEVYLIEYDSIAGTLTAIDTVTTVQGHFQFTNVPFGTYRVKAALLSSDPQYASYLPTYFIQTLYWNSATTISVTPNMPSNAAYIELIQGNNAAGGPGFIGGAITQGANGPGDPMEGVQVILFDANMNPIAYTYSDEDGNYSFNDLAMGVYYIYIESLGLQAAPVEVTLSNGTTSMTDVNFEMGSNYAMFTNIEDVKSISGVSVFPNPVLNDLNLQVQADKTLEANVSVITLTGQVLANEAYTFNNGFNNVSIEANHLATGVYMVRIQTNEGVITQKFVKQ